MKLIRPTMEYKEQFLQATKEYETRLNEDRPDIYGFTLDELNNDFSAYVERVLSESNGENLPDGWVPQTTYWLVDGDEFIGRVSIRHTLTEHLLKEGGHIGYDIRPSKRQMGYGKQILDMSLPKAKELGITKVLVTCNETNIGSKKIIEANGGQLENIVEMGKDKPRKLRYWIHL